jgi:hypothetical protein
MRRGQGRSADDCVDIALPAGACYIITRAAQGRTEYCLAAKVAHQRCSCCWRHGVQTNRQGFVTRQSITIRVHAKWGTGGERARPGRWSAIAADEQ